MPALVFFLGTFLTIVILIALFVPSSHTTTPTSHEDIR